MIVTTFDQFEDVAAGKHRKRATGKFEAIDVAARRIEEVAEVADTHRRVVWAANGSEAARAWFRLSLIDGQEVEGWLVAVPGSSFRLVLHRYQRCIQCLANRDYSGIMAFNSSVAFFSESPQSALMRSMK